MNTINRILNLYISKDGREMLQNPFIQDGYVYATNGHILIRVKDGSLLDNPMYVEQDKPQSAFLFEDVVDCGIITAKEITEKISQIELVDETELVGENVKCDECDGYGEVEWEYERWTRCFDCPVCDGEGYTDKEEYKSTGRKIHDPEDGILIDDRHFKVKYSMVLLSTIEFFNVESVRLQKKVSLSHQMLFHLNENVSVLLMPYLKDCIL